MMKLKLWPAAGCEANAATEFGSRLLGRGEANLSSHAPVQISYMHVCCVEFIQVSNLSSFKFRITHIGIWYHYKTIASI